MKKYISLLLAILTVICFSAPSAAYAAAENSSDTYYAESEFETIESVTMSGAELLSTGLITSYMLSISKSGTTLSISGYTNGTSAVVKCGFTKVTVQRKTSSASSWSTYKTYKSLYADSNYYALSKSLTVDSGYQYRVTATHYAKKSALSTQKITSTTGYLTY